MNIFSFIKSSVPILDVIQPYTTLKKAGLYWKGHCPFHMEKTASFTVSPHKEIFYCFGCHAHGDSISFIAKMENCSTLDAVYFLSERFAITLPQDVLQQKGTADKQYHYAICEKVAKWCHDQFKQSRDARSYMGQRSLSPAILNEYVIGYLPGGTRGINAFLKAMREESVLEVDLVEMHILIKGKERLYSPFEDRVVFPIKDHLGRFCGFGEGYSKQETVELSITTHVKAIILTKVSSYLILIKKKAIQKKNTAFLVEGYMDCIAMVQHGYVNTVATLGTACTLHVLNQLSRYTERVIVIYDADPAGVNALLRIAQLCWNVALDLEVVTLPEGSDPASFLARNLLEPYIDQSQDIFSYFVSILSKNFIKKSLSEKLKIAKKIIMMIHNISDPLKKDLLFQKASSSLGIPIESLKEKPTQKTVVHATLPPQTAELASQERGKKLSKKIFFAMIQDMTLLNHCDINKICLVLADPFKGLVSRLYKLHTLRQEPLQFTEYFDILSTQEKQIVSQVVLEFNDNVKQTLEELVEQLQKIQWKLAVKSIKQNIERAKAEHDHDLVTLLLQELIALKKKMVGSAVGE